MYMDILHIEWLLYYQRCLLSVLQLDARYNWWVTAPNMPHSLFPISHLCILTCITSKLQVIHVYGHLHVAYQTTALLSEIFLVWFKVAWERSNWKDIALDTHQLFSDTHCVYILQAHTCVHTLLFGAQLHMTACCITNKFTANKALFYMNKVG